MFRQVFEAGDPARIGYARVSTSGQDESLQVDALQVAGCGQVFIDQGQSGGKQTQLRPAWKEMSKTLRRGDTLVVWRLDRAGRSLKDLLETVEALEEQGVDFVSLTENIDTSSAGGKLIFHIFGSLAEFERELIRERVNAGLEAARKRGRTGGRPRVLTADVAETVVALLNAGKSHSQIARTVGISKSSVGRAREYLKAAAASGANLEGKRVSTQ